MHVNNINDIVWCRSGWTAGDARMPGSTAQQWVPQTASMYVELPALQSTEKWLDDDDDDESSISKATNDKRKC